MSWTDIPDANLEPGKPLRSVDMLALRDNIIYARNVHGIAVFGANGTFIPVIGVTTYKVTLYGGGGGGGGSYPSAGGSGGAGGFGGVGVFYVNITSPQNIVIGAGGNGGAMYANGTNGGNTSACGFIATGGAGGFAGCQHGPHTNGDDGANGSCGGAGLAAHAGVLALPFYSSYGWRGAGSVLDAGGVSSNSSNGNSGICVIEW